MTNNNSIIGTIGTMPADVNNNCDLNIKNISNIYDEMVKVLEIMKGVESPITYISIYAMCESIVDSVRTHIFKNRRDLDDTDLMVLYSKLLSLLNSFDAKIIKESAKLIEIYKPAKKASK